MSHNNPYQAYTEGSVFSEQPLRLVVALYEGALDATRQAVNCLQAHDIWNRGKAINKGIAIFSELLAALDERQGGELAGNLKRLYHYMQRRLLEAHAGQNAAPLLEVKQLLETLLEGWREAAANGNAAELTRLDGNARQANGPEAPGQQDAHLSLAASRSGRTTAEAQRYADYLGQDTETPVSPVFSF